MRQVTHFVHFALARATTPVHAAAHAGVHAVANAAVNLDVEYLYVETFDRTGRWVRVITGIDHVQLAMPRGHEEAARSFYAGLLEMTELLKPPALASRGGCWFASGAAVLHLGVQESFTPARKAHPALLVDDLDALAAALSAAGYDCVRADGEIPGARRFHCFDPFGNRVEFQQA
jgi:catechol 2,3-dioxygenase-like lactoylglutathione lyase family enzyme